MEGYRIPILNSLYLSITYGFNDLYIWLCRVSLQNACRMLAECLQNACRMLAECLQNACRMLAESSMNCRYKL